MKNQILISTLNRFFPFLFTISILFLASCSDDPESTNEEEVITTVTVTLIPATGEVVILRWDDVNFDGIVGASELITSGPLLANTAYTATIEMLNKSSDSETDITLEIVEEAEDHIFCFTVANLSLTIANQNEDMNGLPVGLTSTWTTGSTASTGSVNITLRHQPGVKTGDCPGAGDTDADITFTLSIEGIAI